MVQFRILVVAAVVMAAPVHARPVPQDPPALMHGITETQVSDERFRRWMGSFRRRALAQGISPETFDTAMGEITFNEQIMELDRNQAEFSKALWEYLDTAVSEARIRNGRQALDRNAAALDQIEQVYQVDKEIIVAIWGLESAYGAVRGNTNTIEAMATLGYRARRHEFFKEQLMAALQILEAGDTTIQNMRGSWAGAMGHTQFMPTSFLELSVDGNGDGRRDIWSDDPVDALASTGNYLRHHGWTYEQPWGVEVQIPEGFDYTTARRQLRILPSVWAARGVLDLDGNPVPDYAEASILLPGGHEGAAFMIFPNFEVLEEYNTADSYVIGVGHLADRIGGGGGIQTPWPREDGALSGADRRELQEHLTEAGFDPQGIDGRIGPLTINAIRLYQLANGLVPDGYASPQLLDRLRGG